MPSGHPDDTKPLRPLSPHAYGKLLELSYGSLPAHRVNPGVRNRFLRGGLATIARGSTLCITPAGREEVRAWVERTRASGKP